MGKEVKDMFDGLWGGTGDASLADYLAGLRGIEIGQALMEQYAEDSKNGLGDPCDTQKENDCAGACILDGY